MRRISAVILGIALMTATLAAGQRPLAAAEASRDARSALRNYAITVYTGDVDGAGTDADVWIFIRGSLRRVRAELDNPGDDFDRGTQDNYSITVNDIGEISQICLYRNDAGLGDEWYVSRVVVGPSAEVRTATATFNAWIPAFGWLCRPAKYNF